ncbi:relaxase/mobilization nuclease domain-containing protein [Acidovorax soli]|uniref:relaxase/mobilization nuclease domain-containing protein n=1 Tax=Acidovorax soli TaxID=592050 RepID=UPI0032B1F263
MQGHRTNSVQEAINYLKGSHDHKGVERKPLPRFLTGSENDCLMACESITRKHKYVSGTLAFEPGERPTDKQLIAVVQEFRKTFMAGLEHGVNFTDFWNIHEDKGRIELNYIIPLTELTTGRQMNPFPVGKAKEDFKDAFDAVTNHNLGYDQIVRNPLKASSSKFETKVLPHSDSELAKQVRAAKPDKDSISVNVGYQILQGNITNRQQLCDYLENFGEITRVNNNFISLKVRGSQKAFRLKGPVYEHGADFKNLKNEFLAKGADYRKQLNDADFQKVSNALKRLTDSRRQFHKKLISQPMTGRSNKNRLYGEKATVKGIPKQPATTNDVQQPQKVKEAPAQAQPTAQPQQPSKPVVEPSSSIKQQQPSTNQPQASDSSSMPSGGSSSDGSIGGLRSQLADLMSQIANAKNPAKAAALKAKATQLENQIGAAVAAERIRKLKEAERFNGMSGKKNKL